MVGIDTASVKGPSTERDVECAPMAEPSEEIIEVDENEQDEQEVEPVAVAPNPMLPSASQVEEHRVTHYPYRSWCRECVEGKALGEKRGRRPGDETSKFIAVIGMDYFYITSKGIFKRKELEFEENPEGEAKLLQQRREGRLVKVLLVRCSQTKAVFAHTVPVKGADEDGHIVKLVCGDIAWIGHTKVILKSDNEPAIKQIVRQALTALKVEVKDMENVTEEHPDKYESQSNGMVEVGIKNFRGHYRTLKSCLERRLGGEIPVSHPASAWLVNHCCLIMNALVRGDDGLTSWMRARGGAVQSETYRICGVMPL